ncbi:hypothetical protein VP01_1182g1, partial [Puccinia sorghi]
FLRHCLHSPDTAAESDTKNPHIWSTIEKTKLLELLIDESSAGRATDNGNLKKEGWTNVMNTSASISTVTKSKIKRMSSERCTSTANSCVTNWVLAGTTKNVLLLRRHQPGMNSSLHILEGTSENFVKNPSQYLILQNVFSLAPLQQARRLQISFHHSSEDESKVDVDRPSEATPKSVTSTSVKRVCDSMGSIVTKSIEGLIGAINQATTCLQPRSTDSGDKGNELSATDNTPSSRALEALASIFLDEAATFFSLVKTSNKKICRMWLDREVANQ